MTFLLSHAKSSGFFPHLVIIVQRREGSACGKYGFHGDILRIYICKKKKLVTASLYPLNSVLISETHAGLLQ